MIPAAFDYVRPRTLDQAVALLVAAEDGKVLAGGHSLLPAMKLRLAQPRTVIDISGIPELKQLRQEGSTLVVGAMTTHAQIESSALLKESCPLLPEVAAQIGDAQVRNRGTIGGSIVHADPAADWPAAVLALDAEMVVAGPAGRRTVKAADFFVEMMQSAVQANEILVEIRLGPTQPSVAYVKFAQTASGFAIAGAAAVVDSASKTVRLALTGVAPKAFRLTALEAELNGKTLTSDAIVAAASKADEGVETLNDIHASAGFRAHLATVSVRRALELAASRA